MFDKLENLPDKLYKPAKELALKLKNAGISDGKVEKHYDIPSIKCIDCEHSIQVNWNTDREEEWGNYGFQIADENGKSIYNGLDAYEAFDYIMDYIKALPNRQ